MNTKATKNLFTLRQRVYAVACHTCHPDTGRIVVLFEKPSKANRFQGLSVSARWIDGKYRGVMTNDVLPIKLEETVWMESPYCEGPYFVGNTTANTVANDMVKDTVFHDIKVASKHVNELNMISMGNPTYTVVDVNGILIDHEGFYTQHSISQSFGQRYAEKIDDNNKSINLNFGDLK